MLLLIFGRSVLLAPGGHFFWLMHGVLCFPPSGTDESRIEHVGLGLVAPQPLGRRRVIDERQTLVHMDSVATVAIGRVGRELHV